MSSFSYLRDLSICCRTCLISTDKMHDLFSFRLDTTLAGILSFCTSIKVDQADVLPKKLCSSCFHCIVSFYDLRRQAEKIDQDLRIYIEEVKHEDSLENIKVESATKYDEDEESNSEKETELLHEENNDDFANDNSDDEFLSQPIESSDTELNNTRIDKCICEVCKKDFKELDKFHMHVLTHEKKDAQKHKLQTYDTNKSKSSVKINQRESTSMVKIVKVKSEIEDLAETEDNKVKCFKSKEDSIGQSDTEKDSKMHFEEIRKKQSKPCSGTVENEKSLAFECEYCLKKYKSIYALSAHMKIHRNSRDLRCRTCHKVFKKLDHLKRHELIHDSSLVYRCSECPRSFRREHMLKQHMAVHNTDNLHQCPSCTKTYLSLTLLKKHLMVHNKEKRIFICPHCGKTFYTTATLKVHIRRHTGEMNYSCSYCPKKFYSYGEMKSHLLIHTNLRKYSCDQCGKTFKKGNSLTKHKKSQHLGIKPHECDVCSRSFSSRDHLKRHYRIHTGEKPYRCDMCDRAFTQNTDLIKHKRQHLGEKLYKCKECSQSFRLQRELVQHQSEHYLAKLQEGKNEENIHTDNINNSKQAKDKDVQVETIDTKNTEKIPAKRNKRKICTAD